ncbi:hypothetical protein [Neorhodopirellula pilleata]|uniref:Uncharacterized protein n=1 Tax=Neorhodopirellula pilleata TaxID=2714738 RepID=A0A5C6AWB1_9BACT|nr:hypothetical protein [Neorhodopirellula pilleata]TWU03918.1 hypothetical protein Pla100_08530 [Neorhodopirellula pilleata]
MISPFLIVEPEPARAGRCPSDASAGVGRCLVKAILGGGGLAAMVVLSGCRGRAHEDLYRQNLQREVRVLEDQLYEADYENRVLIDKLRRERARSDECATDDAPPSRRGGRLRDLIDPNSNTDGPLIPAEPYRGSGQGGDLGHGFDDAPVDDAFRSRGESKVPLPDSFETIPPGPKSPNTPPPASVPKPRPDASTDQPPKPGSESATQPRDFGDLPDIDALVDPGTLVDPGKLTDPGPQMDSEGLVDPGTLLDPGQLQSPPSNPSSSGSPPRKPSGPMMIPDLLPAPGGPMPPGTNDLKIDPIEPGIPTPPNAPNGRPDGPPGKIDFPLSTTMLGGLGQLAGSVPPIELQPTKIRIDSTSSQVRTNDAETSTAAESSESSMSLGVDLVVRADDAYGHPIAILGRSIHPTESLQAETAIKTRPLPKGSIHLSIIALDPTKTGDDAKLGRWDFGTEQLHELETLSRGNQGNGYAMTVPIRWKDRVPQGDSVIFFARLQSDDRDIRCESEISLKKQPSVAGWLPRR